MNPNKYLKELQQMESVSEGKLYSVVRLEREHLERLMELLPDYRTEEFENFIKASKRKIEEVISNN